MQAIGMIRKNIATKQTGHSDPVSVKYRNERHGRSQDGHQEMTVHLYIASASKLRLTDSASESEASQS